MSSSSEEYITATAEERERIREQRCIDYFKDKGVVPCVCVFCGSVVVHRKNLKKHVRSSRCIEQRRFAHPDDFPYMFVP